MQNLFKQLLIDLGEDPHREGLRDTPKRAMNALRYLTGGYKEDLHEIINGALFESDMTEMVIVRDIELYSLCEHHLLPFIGKCHIGYVPNGKVIGLSKIARIVDLFSKRLQIQERLTTEIAQCMEDITGAQGVAVMIEARHLCMMMRGVEKQHSLMTTTKMLGKMKTETSCRSEFLQMIRTGN